MPLTKKQKQKNPKKTFSTKKTWHPRFLECAKPHVFKFPKKNEFFRVFLGFLTKESLILNELKQNILGEIKQSNRIKPPK